MIDELEMRLLHEADHPACNRDIWPEDLLREAAADIVVKKAAIAESARMIHKLMTRALAAEARLAEAMGVIERDIEALTEADTQIEYLHDKFKPTGSGMNALARIDIALTAARAYAAKEKA